MTPVAAPERSYERDTLWGFYNRVLDLLSVRALRWLAAGHEDDPDYAPVLDRLALLEGRVVVRGGRDLR